MAIWEYPFMRLFCLYLLLFLYDFFLYDLTSFDIIMIKISDVSYGTTVSIGV